MRRQRATRNPIVRPTTHKPIAVVQYSKAINNLDTWAAHQAQSLEQLRQAAEAMVQRQVQHKAHQLRRTKQRKKLEQKVRRIIAMSIPAATLLSYLAYRLYGVSRTFSH